MRLKAVIMGGVLTLWVVATAQAEITKASWYDRASCKKEGTSGICADGSRLDDRALTCASWDYKFGTILRVRNIANGKEVLVKVTDRGPARSLWAKGRKLDLSRKAFETISDLSKGIIKVRVEVAV